MKARQGAVPSGADGAVPSGAEGAARTRASRILVKRATQQGRP